MRKLAVLGLVAAFSAGFAVAGLGQSGALKRPLVLRGGASTSPLLGFVFARGKTWLARLGPKTLEPRAGRRLALAGYSTGWSYSPDRRLLAFGRQTSAPITSVPARVRLVDARTLRVVRTVPLGLTGDVAYTHWSGSDRLLALVRSRDDPGQEGEPPVAVDRLVVVDPVAGAVRATERLDGSVIAVARAGGGLVLVLAGPGYGPVRVVVADSDARLASVTLEQIQAGSRLTPDGVMRVDGAAVAVDPQGGRAYVVAGGKPVAEVALDTLAVEYHSLSQPVSLLGRLHDFFEPPAQAKGPMEGSWRSAAWLGDGRLAVYGRDSSTYNADQGLATRERPSGLLVIDTGSWSARMVDPGSSALAVANGALLSWGWSWDSGTDRVDGGGLNVFDQAGVRRAHLYGARLIRDVEVVGARAFVERTGLAGRYSVVDVRTGRELRTVKGRQLPLLLSPAGGLFYG